MYLNDECFNEHTYTYTWHVSLANQTEEIVDKIENTKKT